MSLPAPRRPSTYNPRRDLQVVRAKHRTTGKVIADLKFMFWQQMFTARHEGRIWDQQINKLFPNASQAMGIELRERIYDDLEHIRRLRNRIAHHEPVVTRDLVEDLKRMLELVDIRSSGTGAWLRLIEDASSTVHARP